jgi:hypothetical protein
LCRLLQTDAKNCNLVSATYVSRHEKAIFRNKKTPKNKSRPIGPRSWPCSPLSVTSRRKQLRPSPQSRPEVKSTAERRHLLAEVDRAAMPPEHRRLLGRGRGLPSHIAKLDTMVCRTEEESRRLLTLIGLPCPCTSGGHGGEL